jgi:hypothetical protein
MGDDNDNKNLGGGDSGDGSDPGGDGMDGRDNGERMGNWGSSSDGGSSVGDDSGPGGDSMDGRGSIERWTGRSFSSEANSPGYGPGGDSPDGSGSGERGNEEMNLASTYQTPFQRHMLTTIRYNPPKVGFDPVKAMDPYGSLPSNAFGPSFGAVNTPVGWSNPSYSGSGREPSAFERFGMSSEAGLSILGLGTLAGLYNTFSPAFDPTKFAPAMTRTLSLGATTYSALNPPAFDGKEVRFIDSEDEVERRKLTGSEANSVAAALGFFTGVGTTIATGNPALGLESAAYATPVAKMGLTAVDPEIMPKHFYVRRSDIERFGQNVTAENDHIEAQRSRDDATTRGD